MIAPAPSKAPAATSAGEAVVETRGLTKHYGNGIVAVDNLNLVVRRG